MQPLSSSSEPSEVGKMDKDKVDKVDEVDKDRLDRVQLCSHYLPRQLLLVKRSEPSEATKH